MASQGNCTQSNDVVTCAIGTLDAGAAATITILVRPTITGTNCNQGAVIVDQTDINTENNAAEQCTLVEAGVDLGVTKTAAPDPVELGANLTYTVAVTNVGSETATGVTLEDLLPAQVDFVSVNSTAGNCTETGGLIECNLGALAPGEGAVITIVATANAEGSICNTARVDSAQFELNTENNQSGICVEVLSGSDLAIEKFDSPDPVGAGRDLAYTLVVTNRGFATATGIRIEDTLPADVTFVSATASEGTCTNLGGVIRCDTDALAPGEGLDVTIVVFPTSGALGDTICNTATVSSVTSDFDPGNNLAEACTTVTEDVDLAVSKTDSPDPVEALAVLTYSVAVTNKGPGNATGVTLVDTLPSGVAFQSASSTKGSCVHAGGTVTCTIGDMAVGEIVTATIVVVPQEPDSNGIANLAVVSGNEFDPDSLNNFATTLTVVTPPSGIEAAFDAATLKLKCKEKSGVTNCTASATLELTNNGTADEPPVNVRFFLSSNQTFEAGTDTLLMDSKGNTVFPSKAIQAGKTAKLKLKKAAVPPNVSGMFLLAVDDANNVIAFILFP
jgi:uncharacterized repeat protein (TIGR01451 family)